MTSESIQFFRPSSLIAKGEDIKSRLLFWRYKELPKTGRGRKRTVINEYQYQILARVIDGKNSKEIANELDIQEKTISHAFSQARNRLSPYFMDDKVVAVLFAFGLKNAFLIKEWEDRMN